MKKICTYVDLFAICYINVSDCDKDNCSAYHSKRDLKGNTHLSSLITYLLFMGRPLEVSPDHKTRSSNPHVASHTGINHICHWNPTRNSSHSDICISMFWESSFVDARLHDSSCWIIVKHVYFVHKPTDILEYVCVSVRGWVCACTCVCVRKWMSVCVCV